MHINVCKFWVFHLNQKFKKFFLTEDSGVYLIRLIILELKYGL